MSHRLGGFRRLLAGQPFAAPLPRMLASRELGKTQQPAPDPLRRAALEQELATGAYRDHHPGLALRAPRLRPRRRKLGLSSLAQREAIRGNRAQQARRPRTRAYSGAQLHDRLRVLRHAPARRAGIGDRPQPLLDAWVAGEPHDAELPGQHALDVAVEDRVTLVA